MDTTLDPWYSDPRPPVRPWELDEVDEDGRSLAGAAPRGRRSRPFTDQQLHALASIADALPSEGWTPGWNNGVHASASAAATRHNNGQCPKNCPLHVVGMEVKIVQKHIGPRGGKRWIADVKERNA